MNNVDYQLKRLYRYVLIHGWKIDSCTIDQEFGYVDIGVTLTLNKKTYRSNVILTPVEIQARLRC